jgi:hypothetical protein
MQVRKIGLALGLALCVAIPATAKRTLDVLPSVVWHHAQTGLTLPPYLGALPRNELGDYGTEEADLFAQYRLDDGTAATIYVFHPGLDSVPVWFDRVEAAVRARTDFGKFGEMQPRAFAVPPGAVMAGLRATIALTGGDARSTALAVAPVGDWLVVVRLSSPKLEAAALDGEMTAILDGIGWPPDKPGAPVAVPVKPCGALPHFRKARMLQPNMAQALMGAITGAVAGDDKSKATPPPVYCRAQQAADATWGVYRAEGAEDGYVLALEDAGRAIGVQPSLAALINNSKPAFTVTFMDLTETRTYGDVSALLPPEQALDLVSHHAPIATSSTQGGGKNITISSGLTDKK